MGTKRILAVIGGGAAGVFCAVNAASMDPDLRVVVLEKTGKLLSKVRVSGGGRCNVTHDEEDITVMSNRYPRGKNFVKRSFHGFFTRDTIQWFLDRGVVLKTEADGRMFPVTDRSETIINCLLREASEHGVEFMLNSAVSSVEKLPEGFRIGISRNGKPEQMDVTQLCIACGGFSKQESYKWIEDLGHTIIPPVPSLFTFNAPGNPITALMGVSVPDAEVKIPAMKYKDQGPVLITHWGLSGPAVLRASAWCARELEEKDYSVQVVINWCHGDHEQSMREKLQKYRMEHGRQGVLQKSPVPVPFRLWEFLARSVGVDTHNWADLPAVVQNKLAKQLTAYELEVKGKTTFKEEFVTAGGIQLSEVDPATMQSRKVPGLYFAGEVLDVDGITGGYNFQHAWTSGYNAARHIAGKSLH